MFSNPFTRRSPQSKVYQIGSEAELDAALDEMFSQMFGTADAQPRSTETTYDVEKIRHMYTTGELREERELIPLIVIGMIKDNFNLLGWFDLRKVDSLALLAAMWVAGMRDCECPDPQCENHDIFMALVKCDFDNWQPAAAYTKSE